MHATVLLILLSATSQVGPQTAAGQLPGRAERTPPVRETSALAAQHGLGVVQPPVPPADTSGKPAPMAAGGAVAFAPAGEGEMAGWSSGGDSWGSYAGGRHHVFPGHHHHLCKDPICAIRWHACFGCDPGDMYPWTPKCPVYHGNYYFRPYHYARIFEHQAIAAQWGADPWSPYTSHLFRDLYIEMGLLPAHPPEVIHRPKERPSDYFEPIRGR